MKEKESNEFSWALLFLVTSASFFIFSVVIKFINGSHAGLFLCVSLISLGLAALASIKNIWTANR